MSDFPVTDENPVKCTPLSRQKNDGFEVEKSDRCIVNEIIAEL